MCSVAVGMSGTAQTDIAIARHLKEWQRHTLLIGFSFRRGFCSIIEHRANSRPPQGPPRPPLVSQRPPKRPLV